MERHQDQLHHGSAVSETGSRVLVVEDNPRNQRVVQRLLEKHGHRVRVADNGLEALEAVREEVFDLVVMDIRMPSMDGISATEIIREEGYDMPILALTAYSSDDDRRRCQDVGMNGFLAKPFEQGELLDAVDGLTTGAATSTDAAPISTGYPPVRVHYFRQLMREAGVEELVEEALKVYRDESPGRLERIENAVTDSDARSLEEETHALKSSSLNIWAVELAEYLDQAEHAAVAGDLAAVRRILELIRAEFGRVIAYIEAHLEEPL